MPSPSGIFTLIGNRQSKIIGVIGQLVGAAELEHRRNRDINKRIFCFDFGNCRRIIENRANGFIGKIIQRGPEIIVPCVVLVCWIGELQIKIKSVQIIGVGKINFAVFVFHSGSGLKHYQA